jgi:hypothetical protein
MRNTLSVALVLAISLAPSNSFAQVPGANPATLAMAQNYTALAHGFGAVGLNPAALGLNDSEGFTLSILPFSFTQSLDPLGISDLVDYEGALLPASVKEEWLQSITAAGGQTGAGLVEVTPLSLSWGRLGMQVSTVARGWTDLNPDAAELLFFGNAGRTGQPRDFDLTGSGLTGYALTTVAISAGFPLARQWVPGVEQGLSFGVTIKQTWGHALVVARDRGTELTSDPLELNVEFPVIYPSDDAGFLDGGSGLGVDLGLAWRRGPWDAAISVQNVLNSFEWDLGSMVWRRGQANLTADTTFSEFDEQPGSDAIPALRDRVEELTLDPVATLAGAYRGFEDLAITVELRHRSGDGMDFGPKSHAGMGLEYRPSPYIPLRAGAAYITGGFQAGGGFEIILGPVHLGFAGLYRSGEVDEGFAGSFGLSFGGS